MGEAGSAYGGEGRSIQGLSGSGMGYGLNRAGSG
jgi:hypothetical protein